MNYIGVDQCKGGWFYVVLDDDDSYNAGFCPYVDSADFIHYSSDARLVLIDMPIGLRKGEECKRLVMEGKPWERLCDLKAKEVLRPKRDWTVFSIPCREVVYANDRDEARRLHREFTGEELEDNSLNLSKKIRELARMLKTSDRWRGRIREVHPEVCFGALNGRRSMRYPKEKPSFVDALGENKGEKERLEVLKKVFRKSGELLERARSECGVARDDILDALVAAVTARFGYGKLRTLPEEPERDSQDLPMEMVYYNPP